MCFHGGYGGCLQPSIMYYMKPQATAERLFPLFCILNLHLARGSGAQSQTYPLGWTQELVKVNLTRFPLWLKAKSSQKGKQCLVELCFNAYKWDLTNFTLTDFFKFCNRNNYKVNIKACQCSQTNYKWLNFIKQINMSSSWDVW